MRSWRSDCHISVVVSLLSSVAVTEMISLYSLALVFLSMVQDQLQQKIVCPGVVTCLNASPDGLFLAAAVAEAIYLWEVSRVFCVLKWVSSSKWPFSPQAHLNIISSDLWHVWNMEQQHQCPQRWSPGSRVGSGEWFQSFDWFRCPQVDCCLCSVATIRTSPAWSSQTTAAILFLEEKTTWLSCGTFRGRSHLSKCERTCPVGSYRTCVCVSVWSSWI